MINKRKYAFVKYILELIGWVLLYAMLDNVGGIKKYVVVLGICAVFFVLGFKKCWRIESLLCVAMPVVFYVLLGSLSAFLATSSQNTTIKVIFYVLVPIIFSFVLYVYNGKNMTHIANMNFLGSVLGYALFDAPYFEKIFQWESVYAFVFGIFVIYYAYQKKWMLSIVAMCFVYFAEKRIVILAVLFTLALMGLLKLFEQNKKLVITLWICISIAIFGYIYMIHSGLLESICWGANINTNGRVEMYGRMAAEAEFSLKYLGRGIGIVEQLLEYYNVHAYVNLHNDLLKFYIELGFLGLFIYLASYGIMFFVAEKYFGKISMCYLFLIVTYSMILFATDNTSIYLIYLIPMYVTMFAVLSSGETFRVNYDKKSDK